MVETFCSRMALAATMPPVNTDPIEHVELRLLYDPFKPETVEVHELEWQSGRTLGEYLEGLPTEAEWMIFYNGEEVEDLEAAKGTQINQGDRIGLIVLPQGGNSAKNMLRVVLQIAAVAAMLIPGVGWAAALAINVGIGLINAFLLTPKPPKSKGGQDDGRSYGIDGAKNSATEGIPYPVVYGEFRTAGNFADCYTENVGDDQYLYLRTILNDGLIHSVSDIEVNEQPLTNFKNVQTDIRLGTLTESVNPWFPSSIVQKNKGIKIDQAWVNHLTSAPVDKIRFDVMFPNGLVEIEEDDGDYHNRSVTFEMQYRQVNADGSPIGAGTWQPVPSPDPVVDEDYRTPVTTTGTYTGIVDVGIRVRVPRMILTGAESPGVEYQQDGSSTWTSLGSLSAEPNATGGYVFDSDGSGSIAGPTNVTPQATGGFFSRLPTGGNYRFRGTGGATISGVTAYPSSGTFRGTVTDRRTRQIRKSFTSARLARGYYQVQIRRTTPTSTNNYKIDEVHLTDVAEIDLSEVAMRGTANLSLRIKLNEQLSNIPGLTCKVKGCIVQKYDETGTPTVKEWSNNPAWIGLDIICSIERGAGMPASRIDWPRWIDFANYCDANGITFNGVFDTGTNIGDALRQVLRVGHAAPVPFGTKISVAIDRKRDPVTVFTQASIIEKTFQVTYMSMQDRANEFEVNYYDKTDRNKQKTIRYVDPKAVTFNEMPRSASVSLAGVDNLAQAKAELWRMIYANRLLIRTITFESFMEAINLTLGEVALIQHDQMEWAYNGRLKAGNTTGQLFLDQAVEMDGNPHSVLVHYSALSLGTSVVRGKVGNKLLVDTSGVSLAPLSGRAKRVRATAADIDYEIVKIERGSPYDTITLASPASQLSVGNGVTFWDTDAIEERAVTSVTQMPDGTSRLNLTTALPAAPDQYANFVFGRVTKVRKPYALTGISGNGIEKRKLTFVEYHEGVYGPPEVEIPIPVEAVTDRNVAHVQNLLFDYDRLVKSGTNIINARVHWNAGNIKNYGGADIYMALNGGPLRAIGSAANVTEYHVTLAPNDWVEFQVIAYSTRGDRAPATTAPMVTGHLYVQFAELNPPENFGAETVAFQVDGRVKFSWAVPGNAAGVTGYELHYKRQSDPTWGSAGEVKTTEMQLAGLPTGNYVARVRSVSNTSISVWVEKTFSVVVAPGSLMENWNAANDRNGDPIPAPTLPPTGTVEHTLNSDGSANISMEWLWPGDEATIDGFIVTVTNTPPSP